MKTATLSFIRFASITALMVAAVCLSGCCTIKSTDIAGGGNPTTGLITFGVKIETRTSAECAIAKQIVVSSRAFETAWSGCATNATPPACRKDVDAEYKSHLEVLLDLLRKASTKGPAEQDLVAEAKRATDNYVGAVRQRL